MQQHKFEALDGMRGVLALLVALFHLHILWHLIDTTPLRYTFLAVDFFFILSGFVITHASFEHLTTLKSGGIFVLRRFGRVWPLHVFILSCFVANELAKLALAHGNLAAAFTGPRNSWQAVISNIFMLQSMDVHNTTTWNLPSWSISTEFYAYLLFAVLAIFARRWLTPLSIALCALCLVLLFRLVPNMNATYDYGFLRCVFGFFTGHLVYRFWITRRHQQLACPGITEAACLLLMVLFAAATGNNQASILTPLVFALPVYVLAFQQGRVSRVLQSRPLQKLGLLSYSIYITHFFLLFCFERAFFVLQKLAHHPLFVSYQGPTDATPYDIISFGSPWLMDALAVVYLILVITFAALATRFIETPARTWFNTLAKKWQRNGQSQPLKA